MKVLLFTVPGSTGSLTCSMIGVFKGTFVAPLNGFSLTTTGIVTSGPVPVVKCVVCGATALPATSVTPEILRATCVASGSGACGTSNTSWLLLLKLIVHSTSAVLPAGVITMVLPLTVSELIGLLNRTRMLALSPTFTTPSGGETNTTVGATVSVPAPVVKKMGFWVKGSDSPFVP